MYIMRRQKRAPDSRMWVCLLTECGWGDWKELETILTGGKVELMLLPMVEGR